MDYKVLRYDISSLEDFENLRKLRYYNNQETIININILNDIEFNDDFKPINLRDYNVLLRGNCHNLSNIAIKDVINADGRREYIGLFSRVKNLYVYNLNINKCSIFGDSMCGTLAGQVDENVEIRNCKFDKIEIICKSHSGGLVGLCDTISADNVEIKADINGIDVLGGIVGKTYEYYGKNVLTNCNIKAKGLCKGDQVGFLDKRYIRTLK